MLSYACSCVLNKWPLQVSGIADWIDVNGPTLSWSYNIIYMTAQKKLLVISLA